MSKTVNPLSMLKAFSEATTTLVQKLSKSIVSVNSHMTRGTGIVLDSNGHIITCNHTLAGCNKISVGQGEKTYEAELVGADPYNDIALLKTEKGTFEPIEFGDSSNLSTGQFVLALANPFNRQQPTATSGIITNPDGTIRQWRGTALENIIATDARLNPGFSGGPLVDAEGKMIGMNTAYIWSRGIAIPTHKVKLVVERLMHGGKIKKAYLGIVTGTIQIPQEVAQQASLNQETGVMIYSVEKDSPAKKAGLAMGDVLVKFNGKPVTNSFELPNLLTEDTIDRKTEITIVREEKPVKLEIKPCIAEDEDDE